MKRKLFALLLVTLVLSAVLCTSVCAVDLLTIGASANLVIDEADLLTDAEESALERQAEQLSETHNCNVAIVTVQSLGGKDVGTAAEERFLAEGYNPDGILLYVSIGDRDMVIRTMGKGIDAVTDYGEEKLFDAITASMSRGDYAGAFSTYLSTCGSYLTQYEEGTPYDNYGGGDNGEPKSAFSLGGLLAGLGGGALFGGVPLSKAKREIKNVRSNNTAGNYVRPGSLQMYDTREVFLHQNVTRVAIPKTDTRGGYGGGGTTTHTGAGGATFGGGGGHKF